MISRTDAVGIPPFDQWIRMGLWTPVYESTKASLRCDSDRLRGDVAALEYGIVACQKCDDKQLEVRLTNLLERATFSMAESRIRMYELAARESNDLFDVLARVFRRWRQRRKQVS